jgi:hypothetical protein
MLKCLAAIVHAFRGSEAPTGTVLTGFYQLVTKKSGGQKSKESLINAISYAAVHEKEQPDDKRVIISCSAEQFVRFKTF